MFVFVRIVSYALLGATFLIAVGCSSDETTGEEPNLVKVYDGNSIDLEHTVIVPTLDTQIPKGKNVIWCSSFQIAWNELKDDVIGEPVKINDSDANKIANRLNLAKQSAAGISQDCHYAVAGFVKDGIIKKIQTEMENRFPSVPKPGFELVSPVDIIAYSYLAANVKFKIPFFENKNEFVFKDLQGNETGVTSFGIRPEDDYAYRKLRKQVEILFYRYDTNSHNLMAFGIDLCKYTKPNQIVLACIEPKETLYETLSYIQDNIAKFPTDKLVHQFGINDVLLVPNMFWKITHHFGELEGRYLGNRGYEAYYIKQAIQMIQFKLDRSGAELKSEGKLHVAPIPKHFVFDRPFLIYIKKRSARYPFFVMWVDNAELLSKK